MWGIFHSRTRFERNLALLILAIGVVLAATSAISLLAAKNRFQGLLQGVWQESKADDLKDDLRYFAIEQCSQLAEEGAALLEGASRGCDRGELDAYMDCLAEKLAVEAMDPAPEWLGLYVKGNGWRLVAERDLGGVDSPAEGSRRPSPANRELDGYVSGKRQPRQDDSSMILSLASPHESIGGPAGGGTAVLVLARKTSSEFAERLERAKENVRAPKIESFLNDMVSRQIRDILIPIAVLVLVAIGASRYMCARLSDPLADLVAGMKQVASGDLKFRAQPSKQSEFGFLTDSFNSMADNIERLNEETKQTARMKNEIEMARRIQLNLLPAEIARPEGYEIYGKNVPSLELSGDYYDAVSWGDDERMALLVADVSGKGVPAAMVMSNVQACIHIQALRSGVELDECLAILNNLICEGTDPAVSVTAFMALLSPRGRRVAYVNAGHPPAILIRKGGDVEKLEKGGLVAGFIPDTAYETGEAKLEAGDLILMYSDGVTEAESPAGEEFGEEKLIETLAAARALPMQEIAKSVIKAVREHSQLDVQADDMTLLVLRAKDT
jgi:serine phosphatase RsbU (regulator of sigma subunit)